MFQINMCMQLSTPIFFPLGDRVKKMYFFLGAPNFGPSMDGFFKNEHPRTCLCPHFVIAESSSTLRIGIFATGRVGFEKKRYF